MSTVFFLVLTNDVKGAVEPIRRSMGADELVVFAVRPSPKGDETGRLPPASEADDQGPEPESILAPNAEVRWFLDEELERICSALGLKHRVVELQSESRYEDLLLAILVELKNYRMREKDVERGFFITESSLSVALAALTACLLEGVPVWMPDPIQGQTVQLPVLRLRYDAAVTEREFQTLRSLVGKPDGETMGDLARSLRVSPPTLTARIRRLEKLGLVSSQRGLVRTEVYVALSPAGRLFVRFGGERVDSA